MKDLTNLSPLNMCKCVSYANHSTRENHHRNNTSQYSGASINDFPTVPSPRHLRFPNVWGCPNFRSIAVGAMRNNRRQNKQGLP